MIMRGGGQESRNNNAKDAIIARSFSFVLFELFAFVANLKNFCAHQWMLFLKKISVLQRGAV